MSHEWLKIRLGRVCARCSTTQADGEFRDEDECPRDKPYQAGRNDDPERSKPSE